MVAKLIAQLLAGCIWKCTRCLLSCVLAEAYDLYITRSLLVCTV